MTTGVIKFGKHLRKDFSLKADYTPINHGSYGAYPNVMKPLMKEYQERIEENPDLWHRLEMQEVLETNLKHLGKLMNCDSEDLVFVMHASEGVNNVLRSFPFQKGDKIICVRGNNISC